MDTDVLFDDALAYAEAMTFSDRDVDDALFDRLRAGAVDGLGFLARHHAHNSRRNSGISGYRYTSLTGTWMRRSRAARTAPGNAPRANVRHAMQDERDRLLREARERARNQAR